MRTPNAKSKIWACCIQVGFGISKYLHYDIARGFKIGGVCLRRHRIAEKC